MIWGCGSGAVGPYGVGGEVWQGHIVLGEKCDGVIDIVMWRGALR